EHLLRQVDARQTARGRVERQVEPGADADLQDGLAGLEPEVLDGGVTPRGEDPVEDEVVHGGVQFVGALDLPLLQRYVHVRPSRGLDWRSVRPGRAIAG